MKRTILVALGAILAGPALAADLPVKALPVLTTAPLTMSGWQGFFAGVSQTATGTGVSLGNFGSLTAGGSALGIEVGWESFNGTTLFGVQAGAAYDVMATTGGAAFSDRVLWHAGPRFGGNLGQMLGFQSNPNANAVVQFFANAVPYVAPEVCGHHGMTGYCTTVGAEAVIPNTRLTATAKYINGQFGGQNPGPGQTVSTDNSVEIGVAYHF